MSAAVLVYTQEGFVIGSDGRSPNGHDCDRLEIETDEDVKIFPARAQGIEFAYVITGHVRRGAYHLVSEAACQAEKLSLRQFTGGYEYVSVLSRNLKSYIGEAKRDGLLPESSRHGAVRNEDRGLMASIFMLGYARSRPCWLNSHFYHRNQEAISFRMETSSLAPGHVMSFGSGRIPELIVAGDPRFAKYRDQIIVDLRYATLRTATEFAEAVIASQSDDIAHQVDPDSTRIGGHMHIAAVTPDGFGWIVPPKETRSTLI